jgi:DNA-binding XRE family transcriptional regulator
VSPISAIDRDRYDPGLELALKLAAEFDSPVEELLWTEWQTPARTAVSPRGPF